MTRSRSACVISTTTTVSFAAAAVPARGAVPPVFPGDFPLCRFLDPGLLSFVVLSVLGLSRCCCSAARRVVILASTCCATLMPSGRGAAANRRRTTVFLRGTAPGTALLAPAPCPPGAAIVLAALAVFPMFTTASLATAALSTAAAILALKAESCALRCASMPCCRTCSCMMFCITATRRFFWDSCSSTGRYVWGNEEGHVEGGGGGRGGGGGCCVRGGRRLELTTSFTETPVKPGKRI